jgi:hypothetical protein
LAAAVILAALGTGTALTAVAAGAAAQGAADVPIGKPINGSITYYNNAASMHAERPLMRRHSI